MLERLVPAVVATAETREDVVDIELFPEEQRSLGRAVEKRRREFLAGRACAREALGRLGVPPTAIPNGEHGEPLWPTGIVGSITHCAGYRACAAATIDQVLAIGIDAEPNLPLPDRLLEDVAFGEERALAAASDGVCMDRVLFSAKEAVYKAWFPLAGRSLKFEDVVLSVDRLRATFRARLLVPGPEVDGVRLSELSGSVGVGDGIICTAVVVRPASAKP